MGHSECRLALPSPSPDHTTAEDGEEAYQIVCEERTQIVLTDVKMPRMDGLELSKKILEINPACKIIILSGYDTFEFAKEALSLGVMDYLLKPATVEGITKAVAQAVKQIEEEERNLFRISQLEQQMKKNQGILKEQYLLKLVNAEMGKNQLSPENMEFLGLHFKFKDFFVYIIALDDYSEAEQWKGIRETELIHCGVQNIISELAQRRGYGIEMFTNGNGDMLPFPWILAAAREPPAGIKKGILGAALPVGADLIRWISR